MSDKTHDDQANSHPRQTHWVRTEDGTKEQVITVDAVQEVCRGDAIAVRAASDVGDTVLAGRVTSDPVDDLDAQIEQSREDASGYVADETPVTIGLFSIDADTWWHVADGEVIDRSDRIVDRPQMQPYLGYPLEDAPPCSVSFREDGRIGLRIPGPVANGHRIKYYASEDHGAVVDCISGAIVDPKRVLPNGYDIPD